MNDASLIRLKNGRYIYPAFLDCIRIAVNSRIQDLPVGARLTLRRICGEGFWSMLTPGEQRRAGWCMAHMVKTGETPFCIAESRHEYPVYYYRTE